MADNKQQLRIAVQAALDGDWDTSHRIAQDYSDTTANWLHAVLHKIEGDVGNSHYWYARTSSVGAEARKYTDFNDIRDELTAILDSLN
ncbi:hypothetical protein [Methylotenera versatilis]|uniref:hypothetical protein n=1 Tax=Methylotenera versatilis TaxID=1055487 RepID=UPI000646B775|nr:hypothetical protein [Methylotenera versatilis]